MRRTRHGDVQRAGAKGDRRFKGEQASRETRMQARKDGVESAAERMAREKNASLAGFGSNRLDARQERFLGVLRKSQHFITGRRSFPPE
jgi:hypothetical protein